MAGRWSTYGNDEPEVVPGWLFESVTPASDLAGSNGMTLGPDGRLYVTQVFGSQVTAIDPDGGGHELFSPLGSGIIGPDDARFGPDGTFYATEPLIGRVSARDANGSYRVVRDGLPGANGIAMDHAGRRLFVDEFRPGGRLLELDPSGEREPEVLLEDLNGPNALSMGPDGRLYFPQVFSDQIWAYDLDTRRTELVVDDLSVPTAVKFDSRGRVVTSEAGAGRITAIDLGTGERETLAEVPLGIDNVSVGSDDRIFVSHYVDGRVAEETGGRTRVLSRPGWLGPHGLFPGAGGRLLVADGLSVAALDRRGEVRRLHRLLIDLPGLAVGVAELGGDDVLVTVAGQVLRYGADGSPPSLVVDGLRGPVGVVADGPDRLLVAERDAGRVVRISADGTTDVVASDLSSPAGLAREPEGTCYVSGGPGPIVVLGLDRSRREVGEFGDAQGLAVLGDLLIVADVGRRELVALEPRSGSTEVLVRSAPIGPPAAGVVPAAFCSLCADGDGGVFVGANGEGGIRRLRRR